MKMRLLLAAMLLIAGNALAQSWPTKSVRVIVTFSPGGSSDIVARLIAIPLQSELGQSVIIDNKPGAGGTIGALEAARAAPDGYTLLLSNSAPISISWLCAAPHRSEATVKRPRPAMNTFLRPIRSPSRPASSSTPPNVIR